LSTTVSTIEATMLKRQPLVRIWNGMSGSVYEMSAWCRRARDAGGDGAYRRAPAPGAAP
jgi:hypothetical protein